jgi:hypothetical protein
MPYDKELHFGFVGPEKCFDFAERIKAKIVDYKDKPTTVSKFRQKKYTINIDYDDTIKLKLRTAFTNSISSLGWKIGTILNSTLSSDTDYIGVISPWGDRAASVWRLKCQYDPHECGETPEELTFGVNLSSRYFPSIIDIIDEHGTLGSVFILNKDLFDKIEICKQELIKEIPELYNAEIYLREIFY